MDKPVYEPVKVEAFVTTPEQLTKLLLFCSEAGIHYSPVAAAAFVPVAFDLTPRTPTRTFKEFAGAFALTPKGQISPRGAYDFLIAYIRNHRLQQFDGSILLPPDLQQAIGTNLQRVYPHELLRLAGGAFPPPA